MEVKNLTFFLGQNFLMSNNFGFNIFLGKNFLESKKFGVKIFLGTNFLGSTFLEANASLVLGMSVRQSSSSSVFFCLLSRFSSVLSSQFYSPSVHDDDEG